MNTQQSITVNEREISIFSEKGEKYVAIKPICEAIGVDFGKQLSRIKDDGILGQLYTIRYIVGADNKNREMGVLPLEYIFGWLFTINENKVKPEIKEQVLQYKKECYHALFETFTGRAKILKERLSYQLEIEKIEKELKEEPAYKKLQELKQSIKNSSQRLNVSDKNLVDEQLDLFKN